MRDPAAMAVHHEVALRLDLVCMQLALLIAAKRGNSAFKLVISNSNDHSSLNQRVLLKSFSTMMRHSKIQDIKEAE